MRLQSPFWHASERISIVVARCIFVLVPLRVCFLSLTQSGAFEMGAGWKWIDLAVAARQHVAQQKSGGRDSRPSAPGKRQAASRARLCARKQKVANNFDWSKLEQGHFIDYWRYL